MKDKDREIANREKEDDYALRKFLKQVTQQFLACLPPIAKTVSWTLAVCIIAILLAGTFYIVRDEKKVLDVIWNGVWATLIYMASPFINNFLKKKIIRCVCHG